MIAAMGGGGNREPVGTHGAAVQVASWERLRQNPIVTATPRA